MKCSFRGSVLISPQTQHRLYLDQTFSKCCLYYLLRRNPVAVAIQYFRSPHNELLGSCNPQTASCKPDRLPAQIDKSSEKNNRVYLIMRTKQSFHGSAALIHLFARPLVPVCIKFHHDKSKPTNKRSNNENILGFSEAKLWTDDINFLVVSAVHRN